MLLEFLIYAAIALQFFEMGMLTHVMLTPKKTLKQCITAWFLFAMVGGLERRFFYDGPWKQLFCLLIMTYLWISIMKYCYQESLWKRIVAMCYLYAVAMFGEISISLLLMFSDKSDFDVNGVSYERLVVLLLASFLLFVTAFFFLRVWKRLVYHEKTPGMIIVFLQFLFQLLMLVGAEYPIWGLSISVYGRSVYCEIGELIASIAILYWSYWMIARIHQQTLEESIKALELQLQEEHAYYHTIEQKREAIGKLRHDMNNQIQAARHLIEDGDEKEAEALLDQLAGALNQTR